MSQQGASTLGTYTPEKPRAALPESQQPDVLPDVPAGDEDEALDRISDTLSGKARRSRKAKPAPAPEQQPEADAAPDGPRPCVGLPVQFNDGQRAVAAVLVRESLTAPGTWDLKIMLPGSFSLGSRSGIKRADAPTPGHWNYLPGWQFTG